MQLNQIHTDLVEDDLGRPDQIEATLIQLRPCDVANSERVLGDNPWREFGSHPCDLAEPNSTKQNHR